MRREKEQTTKDPPIGSPKTPAPVRSSAQSLPSVPTPKPVDTSKTTASPMSASDMTVQSTQGPVGNGTTKHAPIKAFTGLKLQKAAPTTTVPRLSKAMNEEDDEDMAESRSRPGFIVFDPITDEAPQGDVDEEEGAVSGTRIDENKAEQTELDPLDAYMLEVEQQLKDDTGDKSRGELLENDEDRRDAVADERMVDLLNIQVKKKKKEVPTIDWEKEKLEPFKKDFFVVTSELPKEEVDRMLTRENIKIRSYTAKPAPQPVTSWTFGFPSRILEIIQELKYEAPTAIQSVAMPVLMSGRDAICIAQTGSGKTMAYMLPLLRVVMHAPAPTASESGPIALVVAPTRELAQQVRMQARPFTKQLKFKIVVAYGGQSVADNIGDIKRGCHILIGTPGRLIELLLLRKLSSEALPCPHH